MRVSAGGGSAADRAGNGGGPRRLVLHRIEHAVPALGPSADRIVILDGLAGLLALPLAAIARFTIPFPEPVAIEVVRLSLLPAALAGAILWPLILRSVDPLYPSLPRAVSRLAVAAFIWLVALSGILYLLDKGIASRLLVIEGALVCAAASAIVGAIVRHPGHEGPAEEVVLPHLGDEAEVAIVKGEPILLDLARLTGSLARPTAILLDGQLLIYPSVLSPTERAIKRLGDIVGGLALLVVFALPMAICALLILVKEGRPILYVDGRAGMYGAPFRLRKFRTMRVGAEAEREALWEANDTQGPAFKIEHDPRITGLGRTLRAYSLDELPQIFDVLAGRMSLVGPRPAGLDEAAKYEPRHRMRLTVRPGLTGLWQVRSRLDADFEQRMADDLEYIRRWSPLLDLEILLRTVRVFLQGGGV